MEPAQASFSRRRYLVAGVPPPTLDPTIVFIDRALENSAVQLGPPVTANCRRQDGERGHPGHRRAASTHEPAAIPACGRPVRL
jgi:hypothetical protein